MTFLPAMTMLGDITVSTSTTATVTFSDIPGGYTHLWVQWQAAISNTAGAGLALDYMRVRFNSDLVSGNYTENRASSDNPIRIPRVQGNYETTLGARGTTIVYFYRKPVSLRYAGSGMVANTSTIASGAPTVDLTPTSYTEVRFNMFTTIWINPASITEVSFVAESATAGQTAYFSNSSAGQPRTRFILWGF